eukprot:8618837-Alexandrium_andersonii.AAC.1
MSANELFRAVAVSTRGFPNLPNGSRHSKLELCGPRSALHVGPRNSRGVHSAQLFALILNMTSKGVVPRGFRGGSEGVQSRSWFNRCTNAQHVLRQFKTAWN